MIPVAQLAEEIAFREDRRQEIRGAIDNFCLDRHGIEGFSKLADQFLPEMEGFGLCLARQIPTVNVEHIAHHLLPEWLTATLGRAFVSLPLSLEQDVYVGVNDYKRSLVSLPWLRRGRNGRFVKHENIIRKGEVQEGRILSSMTTIDGVPLPEHHLGLRSYVFGQGDVLNLSPFFQKLLSESVENGKGPMYAYRQAGGKEQRVCPSPDMTNLRPPADWFYLFYLMLFLDGRCGLLSTVGDNEEVSAWFATVNQTLCDVTGVQPLIIDTPVEVEVEGHCSHLLEYPAAILEEDWRCKISLPSEDPLHSVFQVTECLERQIINLV